MVFLFKIENPRGDNIELLISAENKELAISLLYKELKHFSGSFLNKAQSELKYILSRFKNEKETLLKNKLNKQFSVGNFDFSYNDYLSDPNKFKENFLNEYISYYYRKDFSLEYNLDHQIFEIRNLSEEDLNNKNKVLNKTFIYCGR